MSTKPYFPRSSFKWTPITALVICMILCFIGAIVIGLQSETQDIQTVALGAPKPVQSIWALPPGIYEYQDTWAADTEVFVSVRPVKITGKDAVTHKITGETESDEWTLVSLATGEILPGKDSKLPFTGLLEVKIVDGKKSVSSYKPFP